MNFKERLLLLADKLEANANNPTGMKFDLYEWFSDDTIENHETVEVLKLDCNTTGCAIGLATLTPEFNAEGFGVEKHCFDPQFNDLFGWRAVQSYFGLDYEQAKHLFSDGNYPDGQTKGAVAERAVAARIREFATDLE